MPPFSTHKYQTVLSIWCMLLPRYILLPFKRFPGIPRISSFKFIHNYDNMMYVYYYSGPALGGAETNAVLCKTCSVLCVLEQPRIGNSSAEPLMRGDRLGSSNWSN